MNFLRRSGTLFGTGRESGVQPGLEHGRRTPAIFALAVLLLSLLTACDALDTFSISLPFIAPATTPTPVVLAQTLTPEATEAPTITPTPLPPDEMVIWLPPEFDPHADTNAGRLMQERLAQFADQHGIRVVARIKAASGPSSLLESLTAASAAAPLALPGVVALNRPDFETAALKGLLTPIDGLSTAINHPDWYPYARDLALVQGVAFGLTFAGDGQVMVYRAGQVRPPLDTWDEVVQLGQPFGFAAGSPLGFTTIALYRSVGGQIEDPQRRPMLQTEILVQVLDFYRLGASRGLFPLWMTDFENDGQVWQAYQEQRVNACITWTSYYLSNRLPDSLILPVPRLGDRPHTLASGWIWAVADPLPQRQALSVALVEWLSESEFVSQWSEAAGYLPARPSAMDGWNDQTLRTVLGQVATSASARPSTDLINSLGPVMKDAAVRVIRLEVEPSQAAVEAADRLLNSPSR